MATCQSTPPSSLDGPGMIGSDNQWNIRNYLAATRAEIEGELVSGDDSLAR